MKQQHRNLPKNHSSSFPTFKRLTWLNDLKMLNKLVCYLLLISAIFSCSEKDTLFRLKSSEDTGIHFSNEIDGHLTDTFNVLDFEYMYNGAGVASGDINNDGLLDLYFAGNFVSGQLYLNKGQLKFEDITVQSGITTEKWGTGVSMVDINNDGWLDIYICVAGPSEKEEDHSNYFFINQGLDDNGIPQFKDMAKAFGLADTGYSTMAAFLDYDKDNDLDVYILTNALETYNRNTLRPKITNGSAKSNDRLYRNNGDNTFTNVNQEAGITIEGWGLGVCITDINQDGWSDIYVANDFVSNDLIWVNQKDGTFKDMANDYLKLQTHNGMGVDIADYNNDMLPDIVVLDMLPEGNYREKMMIANGNYDKQQMRREMGFGDQYMRNTLQLNQGKSPDGSIRFSEIGFLSNISKTDWSWAPLIADYDNDGHKDLFIANGYRKDVTNMDYILYNQQTTVMNMFGTEKAKEERIQEQMKKGLDNLEEVKVSNYIFRNEKNLTFKDVTKEWGLDVPSFSNGAIYADLDNDGDLDIVTNNIDEKAMLFENSLYQPEKVNTDHFIRIKLTDKKNNQLLLGSKVMISIDGKRQYAEYNPYRGYKSTVEPVLHYGLGSDVHVDSVMVIWPNNQVSVIKDVQSDQVLNIDYSSAKNIQNNLLTGKPYVNRELGAVTQNNYTFQNVSSSTSISKVSHIENRYDDFKDTPMLPHLLSVLGPYAAKGDLNGDGTEDLVIGADSGTPTTLAFQDRNGDFEIKTLTGDSIYEDRGIFIFDADNDEDNDIYIVSGGSQWKEGHENYQDRLYINNGKGEFEQSFALPELRSSGSVVKGTDFDNDGDIDLFIGGYLLPKSYPLSPNSFILINNNGTFMDKTSEIAPGLQTIGMVTDAEWTDLNNDGLPDLVLAGEWMPIEIFSHTGSNSLERVTSKFGLEKLSGWYHSIHISDIDGDGFQDILAGNTGLNSYYQASVEKPLEIFTKDFDNTGSIDPIMTNYNLGKRYISFFRDQLVSQINGMKGRFQRYDQFAKATFDDSFTEDELEGAHHLKATSLASVILQNTGKGFVEHALPTEAQFSTIKDFATGDFNKDGNVDIMIVGNSFQGDPIRGDYAASFGLLLEGSGNFKFNSIKPSISGLNADGFCEQIVEININGKSCYFITRNDEKPIIYSLENDIDLNL